ncbi:MAG TPA: tetratricopeptide repeat protein, partial [Thermoanaerobaculia bacterium]|nr:tetratricopeptide repeat protein [Thermoanaerobaculia bacterium]
PDYVDAHLNLSLIHAAMGRTDLAVEEFRRVQQLDPENHMPSQTLALFYLLGSRHAEAAAEFRATRLILRRSPIGSWGILWASAGAGRWDEAARSLSDMLGQPVVLDRDPASHRDTFRRELRRLIPLFTAREQSGLVDPYALACIHAQVGDLDSAFAALDRAYDLNSASILWVAVDPRLAILRGDPRYDPYVEKIGLRRWWRDLAPRTATATRGLD